ncbi:predicted protein [Naegleria gruberi]|uniref:Predicted protein n=1 Tax=Naegleria gruberi TaxID=5762 RepID=D2VQE6_NAEGR|nr:uncharacterized protein NAEGRDRAFT_71198 [Naegleria gruberi]EFC40933.1 predicted protein [Naegleria gruberi]|eukprot:XP_002673677.1 predicted protein [Naegleria gruberi strain NEG-M]
MSQPPPKSSSVASSIPKIMPSSSRGNTTNSNLNSQINDGNFNLKRKLSDLLPSMSTLRTVQHCSGLIFSIFTTLHSVNSIVANTELHDEYLDWSRGIFRYSPITEAVLVLGPLFTHMGSSIALSIKRSLNNVQRNQDGYSKFQSLSGFALVAILPLHISVNRVIPKNPLTSDQLIPQGVNPFAWFIPSALLLSLGLYHTIYGIKTALKLKLGAQTLVFAVSALSLLGLAGLANLLQ